MNSPKLNKAQQAAVDHIYGPLLVLAGPGTGKTQLLSARTANILQVTDANPQNILCLTFTENAAHNMRQRLNSMIGADAYNVHIGTYHSFGSDVITSYPEYFECVNIETNKDSRLERPIDDLQKFQIVSEIVNKLPYTNPLVGAKRYIGSVTNTISELKRGLYTPSSLCNLAAQNLRQVDEISELISTELGVIKRMPSKAETSIELFSGLIDILSNQSGLAELAYDELEHALAEATDSQSSKPVTAWKNEWLTKDEDDHFLFTDRPKHERMTALAGVFDSYQEALEESGLFDFDDMILRSIDALTKHDDLRYTLQEKYQFILLDEFQDTNTAQYQLVRLLTDNPVNEGQPNVFAVGDDDQAIYAFQGAKLSNMLQFTQDFRDVSVINLVENYRSHPDILHAAKNISDQLSVRLHHNLEGISKELTASGKHTASMIERISLESKASEYGWIADRIKGLVNSGVKASEIAVISPKHTLLEDLVPFCLKQDIPISYERRENILETKLVRSYELMIKLLAATSREDTHTMNELFPKVLSLDFYKISPLDIWSINWQHKTTDEQRTWAEIALDNEQLQQHVTFYLGLGLRLTETPLERVLDLLTGSESLDIAGDEYTSPLKAHYFDNQTDELTYYESLSHLSTIREHLRSYQSNSNELLTADDFLRFTQSYTLADQQLIDSHPINTSSDSVSFMTAYKAKGLEFEHVFILSAHEDVWGTKSRGNSNKLALPQNLQHIRYKGSSEDELIRLLFVAATRAKKGLHITSHQTKDTGKNNEPVKYLLESDNISTVLPDHSQAVTHVDFENVDQLKQVELLWEGRHIKPEAQLKDLLKERLQSYQMSPTHLNTVTDTEYGGWDVFLLNTLLRFPHAPGEDGEFGNAVHETLDWMQKEHNARSALPSSDSALGVFESKLKKRYIQKDKIEDFIDRGRSALKKYLSARTEMFARSAQSEVDFRKEGVLVGEAHLTGKIDRLEIDTKAKTIRIVDFKTGSPEPKWSSSLKLKKYKQQLYFYKLLIEGSHTWKGYTVEEARLEFVEPDSSGNIVNPLVVQFKPAEEAHLKEIITTVWNSIHNLEDPELA